MKYPRVIAIIPAHNSANYVGKAITSILQQDYPALRVIVIDDCSQDNTLLVAHSYDEHVEIIHNNTNLGFFGSLNKGLTFIQNEDILLVNQDDVTILDSDYISRAVQYFNKPEIAVVAGQATGFSRSQFPLMKRTFSRFCYYDYIEKEVTEATFTFVKADLFRISALREVGGFTYESPFNRLLQEDQIIAKKLREAGYILLKDPSLHYQLDHARTETLWSLLRKEARAGKDLGILIGSGAIEMNPKGSGENRAKRNFRWSQIITVTLIIISLLLMFFSVPTGISMLLAVLVLRIIDLYRRSHGFLFYEKFYFIGVGLVFDIIASLTIYFGLTLGIFNRIKQHISR